MPLSSQMHVPALMGEDEHSIRYGCAPEEYEAEGHETKDMDGVLVTMARRKGDGAMGVVACEFMKPAFDTDKAHAWLAAQKFSIEPADLHAVKDVEIFSTGLWNGKQITDQDLDRIVEAYHSTRGTVAPFLKLGHDEDQKLLQQDGLPAAGWVENVRKVGSKLVADFVDIPKKIYQLISNRAYRKVSCEIYNNVNIDGATYPKMLGAVALLGSDLPGVLNLSDILSLYSRPSHAPSIAKFARSEAAAIISSVDIHTNREDGMSQEVDAYKAKLEQAEKDVGDLKEQAAAAQAEVEKYKKEAEEARTKAAEAAAKEEAARVDAFVTELQGEKLCSKAMAPMVKELMGPEKETYAIGENTAATKRDLLKEILKGAKEASKVNFSETTKDEKAADKPDLEAEVEKYAKDNKVSFGAAYRAVTRGKDLAAKAMYQEEMDA